MDITTVDKNFKVETSISAEGLVFENCRSGRFRIEGVRYEDVEGNGMFVRMPQEKAKGVSDMVGYLSRLTAGGKIRFRTDSPYVAVHVKIHSAGKMSHFPLSGSVGCDLFARFGEEERFISALLPAFEVQDSYENIGYILGWDGQMHDITVNMPTYTGVYDLFIGYKEGSRIEPPREHRIEKPVVFYGSSITQGGCCSRPSNTYEDMLARWLDFNYINLGFSGSAVGEEAIGAYLAELPMSAFVYDYDHNACNAEHLSKTHERLFRQVRQKQPDVPILIMTRPRFHLSAEEIERMETIRKTYDNAVAQGDKNVYWLSGPELIPEDVCDLALVDGCHPNDVGFYFMAKAIRPILSQMLGITDKD